VEGEGFDVEVEIAEVIPMDPPSRLIRTGLKWCCQLQSMRDILNRAPEPQVVDLVKAPVRSEVAAA